MSQIIDRYSIAEFTNPSGKAVWRIQGRKPDGVRVRINFKTLAEARARKQQFDVEWLNLQAGSSCHTDNRTIPTIVCGNILTSSQKEKTCFRMNLPGLCTQIIRMCLANI